MSLGSQWHQPGDRIGDRYTLIRKLGGGADGEVFLVRDLHLDKEVALKILTPKSDGAATWDEAQLLEQLQSEFLVPVFNADVLHPSDLRYIATAYIPGGDLGERVKPVGTSVGQAVQWGIHIAHGLVRMHTSGLVHRDVKPGNAFVTGGGKALLGDLGKAHRLNEMGQAPPDGNFQTVAPEVLTRGVCSVASDVYSLGATVCYLLTGKFPVDTGGSTAQVRDRIVAGDKRKVRDLGPHVPQSVGQILERCLTVDPAARPATALDVANRLAAARLQQRDWRLLDHSEHVLCMEGGPSRSARPVTVCAIPIRGSRCDITVTLSTGRRVPRHEAKEVHLSQVRQEMRLRAKEI
ncbi:serine/threonine-protein kinase [Micromonospora sp. WMMA1976]|uniref:serine/threonine-protein kinase n=1 Tax=Micromonospora sp. WMMA1976 TaxID=3014995 RepID=UPI00248C2CD3|nr:serine/threonine-protein kinase [Micromonospora sp. WMMA1976]WBC01128.1 serine/threonine-protein kinase [Micromonospora sp. WMMA1976]